MGMGEVWSQSHTIEMGGIWDQGVGGLISRRFHLGCRLLLTRAV